MKSCQDTNDCRILSNERKVAGQGKEEQGDHTCESSLVDRNWQLK